MEQKISLRINDYLNHQLYVASKSKFVQRRIYGSRILVVAIFLSASIYAYNNASEKLSYFLLVLTIISALFHPMYTKWRYKKYYLKYIKTHYESKIGLLFSIEFDENYILMSDDTGDSRTLITEIKEINDTTNYIFILLHNTQSIVIPKVQLRGDRFMDELTEIAKRLKIKLSQDLNWKSLP